MTRWSTSTPTSATCTTVISTEPSALPTPQILINGQIWADQLQPLAGTIPAGRAKAKHLAALDQPVLFGGVRRPPACQVLAMGDQPLIELAGEQWDAVHPGVMPHQWQVMQTLRLRVFCMVPSSR